MPDQRSVMKEYRSLEQKRAAQGLTPAEEARHAQLRDLIGPEMGAGGLQGGFDVSAAAARLRESLVPAGVRNRPPAPPPEPPAEPEPALSPHDAVASASGSPPFEPLASGLSADALFDASTMEDPAAAPGDAALQAEWTEAPAYDAAASEAEGAIFPGGDAAAGGWDPAQPYADPAIGEWAQPGADAAAYDPTVPPYDPAAAQPYDPDAQAAWDAGQPYDPNATYADPGDASAAGLDAGAQPGWDPGAHSDPNAAQEWEAGQPYDPNAAPAWDAGQPLDPNAAPAWDAGQPLDPNAAPAWEAGQPYDPNAAPAWEVGQPLDPNAAPAWDAGQPLDPNAPPAWDAGQPLDPNAPPAWDAGQPLDPNAPPAWDAGQPFDPNAPPAWDAGQPFDPNAPPAWDAGQPFDPNAPQAWDAAQPSDAGAPDAAAAPFEAVDDGAAPPDAGPAHAPAWDPDAPFDPGAPPAWDASPPPDPSAPEAAPHDPSADGLDANVPGWSPDAQAEWTVNAPAAEPGPPFDLGTPYGEPEPVPGADAAPLHSDPGALLPPEGWEMAPPGPDAPAEAALGEYDETATTGGIGEDAGLESALPFEAFAAEPEPEPELGAGPPVLGEYDDTAGFAGGAFPDAAPADLPPEGAGFEAAQAMASAATEGWNPEPAVDDGFLLESGGSFDAADAAAAPEWALGDHARPWESAEAPEALLGDGAPATDGAAEPARAADALPEPPADALVDAPAAPAEPEAELPSFDVDVSDAFEAEPGLEDAGLPAAAEVAPADGDLALEPEAPAPELSGPAPALDFSRPDLSDGQPEDDFALPPDPHGPPPEGAIALDAIVDDDIPTIDGEELLEEIPLEDGAAAPAPVLDFGPLDAAPSETSEPAPPPPAPVLVPPPPPAIAAPPPAAPPPPPAIAAPPPPPPAPSLTAPPPAAPPPSVERVVPGVHRVVVHTVEGQVRRGVLEDADLAAASLGLSAQPGGAPELVGTEKVKAIFFMLSPGEKPPAPEGKKVRVTFRDGRQIAGFSPDYDDSGAGFFMVPGDTRTNTGRIWVYRASVKQVSVT